MRLFVALRPPPSIRQQLIAAMGGVPVARWQDDAQLHCTLRSIGEVDRPQAEDVAAALAAVHAETPMVRIAGVGRFEHKGRTDTLWAGLAPHDALRHLADARRSSSDDHAAGARRAGPSTLSVCATTA